jgi:Holliday junction DNA helicase RuvA
MIGYLEGQIKYATTGKVILFCNGIGFTVSLPNNLAFLKGQKVELYIHTHLREDNLALFGFSTPEDLSLFETLIGVNGIGPKIGLAMFTSASAEMIKQAISSSNLTFFTSIPGVGKKTAQRIILDLKSKISKGDVNMDNLEGNSELVDSLVGLGFQKSEISQIITQVDSSQSISTQIKSALKLLNHR